MDVVTEWAFKKAMADLKARGIGNYTYQVAMDLYAQGYMDDDDYDLFSDAWKASTHKYSVSESVRKAAQDRLIERYR